VNKYNSVKQSKDDAEVDLCTDLFRDSERDAQPRSWKLKFQAKDGQSLKHLSVLFQPDPDIV
jgi:hypothetical protein